MKGLENQTYLIAYLISNAVAILMLISAWRWPRVGRLMFLMLFAWACWINWKTVLSAPEVYLDYADLTLSDLYKKFITGWFSEHIQLVVGFIATCQGLIAVSMLLRGKVYTIGLIGGIIFLYAIIPFGVGSAFPATLIMALAMVVLSRGNPDYLWLRNIPYKHPNYRILNQKHHPVIH
ncbi:hypothetical protein [Adhaeribacter rhizoryzae]|uniref:DoxX family protein n=1 Tax=Adhaeribacter rhizoryzae TaxID=2607907 RepID=A0A5M6CZU5_9BACT|nr:hypothetical protein [Adhaeribacter rhizoryzae]KAA5539950.1 hypothetical protein F0145_23465 [Adhaeribacter rhizoryzae]